MSRIDRPTSLEEALGLLAEPDARPIGGGVAVLLRARLGEPPAARYVALASLRELREIDTEAGGMHLVAGGAVTLAELAVSPLTREHAPLLAEAAAAAASPGIRSIATLAGNLVDAPADSDLVAAAIALDARLELRSTLGTRLVSPATALAPGEAVTALRLPVRPAAGWGLRRLLTQGAADRPAATVAVALEASGGIVTGLRVAATFLADRPLNLSGPLGGLAGTPVADLASGALHERIGAAVLDGIDRAAAAGLVLQDDLRASAGYRRIVLGVLAARTAADAAARRLP